MKHSAIISAAAAVVLAGSVGVSALPRAQAAPARAGTTYRMIMNWFPEPEEGGFYAAVQEGLYKKAGIDVQILPFGYSIATEAYLLAGHADFAMGNADEILQFKARGADLVAVVGSFQTNPQGIIWHAEDTSIKSLADLSNHTLVYSFGAGYEPYLVLKYKYTNFNTRNNDFTSRYFSLHKDAVNQCYVTSEPYLWAKQGLKIKYALIASSGYNPYAGLMFTTGDFITKHPAVVKAFVQASVQGWKNYMKNPTATNAYLQTAAGAKDYPETPAQQQFSYSQMVKLGLISGGDAKMNGLGSFTLARWKTLQSQMVSVGQKVGSVDVSKAFTDQFLPAPSM